MKISNVTNQAFGHLYQASDLIKKVSSQKATKRFLQEYSDIKNIISENKLDSQKYIDINLCHSDVDGFSAVVWPKNDFTPYAPNTEIFLKTTKDGIDKFVNWTKNWNNAYTPRNSK